MAHSISAKKRVRQNARRRARNRARKEVLKDVIKTFTAAISGGDVAKAETEFRTATRRIDKVAAKGTIHKNTAARKRSRLAKRLNVLKAGGGAKGATAKA
ncbi:MAG TPA: 30S ribosomal protein S20 [Tepidisphaeraceae bacterium]|nr:30S ribosomal protein S20 [Tepidisphaeraceae bacterium]